MAEFFANFLAPNKTVYAEWGIIVLVLVFSLLATRKMTDVPGKIQNMAEMAVSKLLNYFSGIMGEAAAREYLPAMGTLFIFIVVSNYSSELPGSGEIFQVPTAVLAAPAALGIIAFATIHTAGFKKLGFKGYLKSFLKPVALLLPITLLEQIVRPVSLALRLYGNLFGEEQVTEQMYEMFPVLLPLIMQILSLMFSLIQAMIFTMLLGIFIGEATEVEEEEPKKSEAEEPKKIEAVENQKIEAEESINIETVY